MKIGDVVKATSDKDYCNDKALGIIVDSKKVAATRRADRGRDTYVHQVCWSAPSYSVVWVMERDLTQMAKR